MEDKNKAGILNLISSAESKQEIQRYTAFEALIDFFKIRLERISKQEKFKSVIQNKIAQDVKENKLSSSELINLYKVVCSENTDAIDSVFSLVRPSATNTPLFDAKKEDSVLNDLQTGQEYTSEQMEKIDKFMRMMISVVEQKPDNDEK